VGNSFLYVAVEQGNRANSCQSQEKDFKEFINPNSFKVLNGCKLEPSLKDAERESKYQFQRLGYFCVDKGDSKPGNLVFNRTVPLKDSWSKKNK